MISPVSRYSKAYVEQLSPFTEILNFSLSGARGHNFTSMGIEVIYELCNICCHGKMMKTEDGLRSELQT